MERGAVGIEQVTEVSPELAAALEGLVGQLSSSASPPALAELREVAGSPATTLLVARDEGGAVVGTLTLAVFRIPSGVRAWIEDVVVDQAARGRGTGEALTREALRLASEAGARTVDLTSRPGREAANSLYRKLGFERRQTNVYRYDLAVVR